MTRDDDDRPFYGPPGDPRQLSLAIGPDGLASGKAQKLRPLMLRRIPDAEEGQPRVEARLAVLQGEALSAELARWSAWVTRARPRSAPHAVGKTTPEDWTYREGEEIPPLLMPGLCLFIGDVGYPHLAYELWPRGLADVADRPVPRLDLLGTDPRWIDLMAAWNGRTPAGVRLGAPFAVAAAKMARMCWSVAGTPLVDHYLAWGAALLSGPIRGAFGSRDWIGPFLAERDPEAGKRDGAARAVRAELDREALMLRRAFLEAVPAPPLPVAERRAGEVWPVDELLAAHLERIGPEGKALAGQVRTSSAGGEEQGKPLWRLWVNPSASVLASGARTDPPAPWLASLALVLWLDRVRPRMERAAKLYPAFRVGEAEELASAMSPRAKTRSPSASARALVPDAVEVRELVGPDGASLAMLAPSELADTARLISRATNGHDLDVAWFLLRHFALVRASNIIEGRPERRPVAEFTGIRDFVEQMGKTPGGNNLKAIRESLSRLSTLRTYVRDGPGGQVIETSQLVEVAWRKHGKRERLWVAPGILLGEMLDLDKRDGWRAAAPAVPLPAVPPGRAAVKYRAAAIYIEVALGNGGPLALTRPTSARALATWERKVGATRADAHQAGGALIPWDQVAEHADLSAAQMERGRRLWLSSGWLVEPAPRRIMYGPAVAPEARAFLLEGWARSAAGRKGGRASGRRRRKRRK